MRVLLLILSSHGPAYDLFKETWKLIMNTHPHIDAFFLELSEDIASDVVTIRNTLLFKGTESIVPGCWRKTLLALRRFSGQYDFVVRTNLSSLLDLTKLCAHLKSINPELYYAGVPITYEEENELFCSGALFILSKDVATYVAEHGTLKTELHDDVYVGQLIVEEYGDIRTPLNRQDHPRIDLTDEDTFHYRFKTLSRIHDVHAHRKCAICLEFKAWMAPKEL